MNMYLKMHNLDKLELGQQKQRNKLHTIGYVLLWFIVPLTLVVGIDRSDNQAERKKKQGAGRSPPDNENGKL